MSQFTGRQHPRFVAATRVELSVEGGQELQRLWTENVSRGGLFVVTDEPPCVGTRVAVQMETPEGRVTLQADVVHVIDKLTAEALGCPAGAGLQFVQPDDATEEAIRRYVEELANAAGQGATAHPQGPVNEVLAAARRVLLLADEGKLYESLSVEAGDAEATLRSRIQELLQRFQAPPEGATPPQLARFAAAARTVQRVSNLLLDAQRRLEYDLRIGHVHAEARIAEAREQGRSIEQFRNTWHQLFPDRVTQAAEHARTAMDEEALEHWDAACTAGQKALELDPFNQELREMLKNWEAKAGEGQPARLPH